MALRSLDCILVEREALKVVQAERCCVKYVSHVGLLSFESVRLFCLKSPLVPRPCSRVYHEFIHVVIQQMHVGYQLCARLCAQHRTADSRQPKALAQEDVNPACRSQERPPKDSGLRVQGAGDGVARRAKGSLAEGSTKGV